jgi:uncharacterized protein involved in exopolysaccharide biosynthesis
MDSLQKLPESTPPRLLPETQPPQPTTPYYESAEPIGVEEDPFVTLLEYWHILRQRKLTVIALTLMGILAGLSFSIYQVPKYEARTSIEIQGSQGGVSGLSFVAPVDTFITTQIDILKSRTLLTRVRSKMKPPAETGSQVSGDVLTPWRNALGLYHRTGVEAWEEAVATAQGTLKVDSTRDSNILVLRCESTHPAIAAEFVNTTVKEYVEQRLEERWNTYQSTSKWLNQAQDELRAKLEASEAELQRFARSSGLLFTSDTQNVSEEKLKQLQGSLTSAQALRISREAQYEASKSSRPEALPEVLDSGPVSTYQVQLTELRRQLAELSSALTPEHYKIKRLQAQISELETVLGRERGAILKRIRNEYEAALRTENQIRAEYDRQVRLISGQAEDLIHYRILKREAETNRQLYELTLQKGKEASIASA